MSNLLKMIFLKYAGKPEDYKLCFGYNLGLYNNPGP